MSLDLLSRSRLPPNNRIITDEDDVIEREKELRLPLHKRLELVAGFNIHQLVRDARRNRHTLHTRDGFYLSTSPGDMAALFERSPTRSSGARSRRSKQSSKESTTASSIQSDLTLIESSDILRFCPIHGVNVTLSADGRTASRFPNTFCDGLVFGQRPMNVDEQIHIRLDKVRRDWRGGFRLGFTSRDPSRLDPSSLPSYGVPDMSRSSRFWAVPIPDRYVAKNNVFSFILQANGHVLYSVNNQNKGIFLRGMNCRKSWFPLIDLYGKVVQISMVDEKTAALGNANFAPEDSDDEEDKRGRTSDPESQSCSFHPNSGRNIRMDTRRRIAKRVDSFWNSLVFLQEPIRPRDVIFVEISKANTDYAGALGAGVTDVDPSTIVELPDNADLLTKNTAQYWHLSRDVETKQGDQLGFELDNSGQITCSKNGDIAFLLMTVNVTRDPLWFTLDVYGSTTIVRLLGIIKACDPTQNDNFALDLDSLEFDDDKECMMCFKAERECAIQPCGHVTVCCWCAITCLVKQSLRCIVCPICGGPVCDVIKILSADSEKEGK